MYIFSPAYWFNLRPAPLSGPGKLLTLIIILALIVLIVFLKKKMQDRKSIYFAFYRHLVNCAFLNIFLCFLWLFFTYELIPIVSARFWIIIWIISMGAWIYQKSKILKKITKDRAAAEAKIEYNKYLP